MSLPVVNAENHLVGTLAKSSSGLKAQPIQETLGSIADHESSSGYCTINSTYSIPYFVEKSFNYIPVVEDR